MKISRLLKILVAAFLSIGLAVTLSLVLPTLVFNVNTMHTVTSMSFIDGYACVSADYTGYEDALDILVNVRIERKNSLFSYEEIVNDDRRAKAESYREEFVYPIDRDGIYRCTVTYTVTGAEGRDVITFRDTQTYKAADHLEHTHVWDTETVIESATCTKAGQTEKLCRCGEKSVFEIEKAPHTPGEPVVAIPPAGGKYGVMCRYCKVCNQVLSQEPIPPTGSVGLAYRVNDDGKTCTVTGMGTCTDKIVMINEYIDGYRVTVIGKDAFRGTAITSIKLPDSVVTIGEFAFSESQLASVKLSANLCEIGERAFYGCSAITRLELPETLTVLGKGTFVGMSGIYTIEIPSGVSEIPEMLLYGCSSLYEIKLHNAIRSIGSEAFAHTAIRSLTLPAALTEVADGLLRNCDSLTAVTIPSEAVRIGEYAFEYCKALTAVDIPDSVTEIGQYAFSFCTSLSEVQLPQALSVIEPRTFFNCSSLRSVSFPDALTAIGESAFEYCASLSAVHLPESALRLSASIFGGCTRLSEVSLPTGLTEIPDGMFRNCNLTESVLNDGITSIGKFAFSGCPFESIRIPDSVTRERRHNGMPLKKESGRMRPIP